MKSSLRNLKARLQKAGDVIEGRPPCERCPCSRCVRLRRMISMECRLLYGILVGRAIDVLIRIGPDSQSEIIQGLEKSGLKLVRINSQEEKAPSSEDDRTSELRDLVDLTSKIT